MSSLTHKITGLEKDFTLPHPSKSRCKKEYFFPFLVYTQFLTFLVYFGKLLTNSLVLSQFNCIITHFLE